MHKKLSRAISISLCVLMMASLFTACGKEELKEAAAEPLELMEQEEVITYSFDAIGGKDVMPLAGYFGPQAYSYSAKGQNIPDYFSDEFFQMVVDCGVNLFSANGAEYSTYPDKTLELLEQCQKFGMGTFVNDYTINQKLGEETLSVKALDEQLHNYINHPACVGAYVVDEPKSDTYMVETASRTLKEYAPLVQNLAELHITPYMNLFPMASAGTADLYEDYLKECLDTCPIPFLSYDRYPFNEGNDLTYANDYFVNMSIVREAAEEAGIPFWCFVQAGAQWNDAMDHFDSKGYWPEQGAFLWQANTSLAFGAKGLQYFPLLQPYWFAYAQTEDFDFERNGLISAWGTKNRWWYYAQIANTQIKAVDEVLMNSVNKGIIASTAKVRGDFKDVQYVMDKNAWRELTGVTGDAMIGCFNYYGKSAFYVVNYDIKYAQKITLNFSNNYKMKVVQKGKEAYYATNSLELTMTAGEGVLVVRE